MSRAFFFFLLPFSVCWVAALFSCHVKGCLFLLWTSSRDSDLFFFLCANNRVFNEDGTRASREGRLCCWHYEHVETVFSCTWLNGGVRRPAPRFLKKLDAPFFFCCYWTLKKLSFFFLFSFLLDLFFFVVCVYYIYIAVFCLPSFNLTNVWAKWLAISSF